MVIFYSYVSLPDDSHSLGLSEKARYGQSPQSSAPRALRISAKWHWRWAVFRLGDLCGVYGGLMEIYPLVN